MSAKSPKRMRVFAGPNGSGKSTIIKEIQKAYNTGTYINADDIEKAAKEKGFVNSEIITLKQIQQNLMYTLNNPRYCRKPGRMDLLLI
ncbi:ATP-binding cassette domain-containing protein [Chitinophaga sp.]|uniref:ATP-binding cassette domain-containing protein n=1 Tax=Chitinophaga sp. TaxID=1869181 RepID=UPI002F95F374